MDRLVLGEIVGLFVGGVAMFTTLFFATGELLRYVEFIQNGEGWGLVLKLIVMTVPMALSYTVGMGMLLACLLGFGRLSDDAELTAITAAGVSFPRVMAPVVAFGGLASLLLGLGVHTIIPTTMRTRQILLDNSKKMIGTGPKSSEAVFLAQPYNGGTLVLSALGGVSNDGEGVATLEDVTIAVIQDEKTRYFTHAKRARWQIEEKTWKLEGIDRLVLWENDELATISGPELTTRREVFALKPPGELSVFDRGIMEHTSAELRIRARIERETNRVKESRKTLTEIARRDSMALAPLVFAIIGAPLGVRPKRAGSGLGYALSVLITFVYWMLSQLCLSLGSGGSLPPQVAGQLANILGLGLGMFFISRVVRYNRV